MKLILTPLELPDRLASLVTPPRVHRQSSDEGERRGLPGKIAARCWALLLARSPPQGELSFDAGVEATGREAWPEIDQADGSDDGWG
jgi:hypothetical protein